MASNKGNTNKKVVSRPGLTLYICSLGVLALSTLFLIFTYNRLPPEVPLYYGRPPGAKQIADKIYLILPIGLTFFLILVNYFFAYLNKDGYLRHIFAVLSLFLSTISAIAVIKIILLVGNL